MNAISATSRLPFFNPELHAMAFSVVGDHARAQGLVERALSAYALRFRELGYEEHPWTKPIESLTEWTPSHRVELMDQLWDIIARESTTSNDGFFQLGVSERMALFLRARTSLELHEIAQILQLSTTETVALLERARRELLDRCAPHLLLEPVGYKCRHGIRAEALAALDADRFADDYILRHMQECPECTTRYSDARKRRDVWLAFIPEGTIPREIQRDFEERLPKMLKEILPQNTRGARALASRVGRGGVMASRDLFLAATRPSFLFTIAGVMLLTWIVWAAR